MANENENKESPKDNSTTSPDVAKAFYGDKAATEKKESTPEVVDAPAKEGEQKEVDGEKKPDAKDAPPPKEGEAAKPGDETKKDPENKEGEAVKDGEKKAPEKYDLKIPDGSKLKATAITRIDRIAREQGLTNDEAQQLLVQEHEAVTNYATELDQEFTRIKQGWKQELENDPELGGANLKSNSELVRRAMEANFSKETIEMIDTMEYGNNKALFRDLLKLGKRMGNDKITPAGGNPPGARKRSEDVFYGKKEI